MNDYIIPGYVPNGTADEYAWMDRFLNPEPWMRDGLCRQVDPDQFFAAGDRHPGIEKRTRDAKNICASCDVREQCLAYALRNDEKYGVWGGLSEKERRKLRVNTNKERTA